MNCQCTYEDDIEIQIIQTIRVDRCIAEEIKYLNANGVRTEGSCCGHGEYQPHAIIKPSSVKKAKELGYNPMFDGDIWKIELNMGKGRIIS